MLISVILLSCFLLYAVDDVSSFIVTRRLQLDDMEYNRKLIIKQNTEAKLRLEQVSDSIRITAADLNKIKREMDTLYVSVKEDTHE